MENEYISIREFAKRISIGEKTIRDAIKNGKINEGATTVNGNVKIIYHKALKECEVFNIGAKASYGKDKPPLPKLNEPFTPKKQNVVDKVVEVEIIDGIGGLFSNSTLAEAQRLQTIYKAQLASLEVDKESGVLVSKEEVYMELYNYGSEVRSNILSVPDRITDELISLSGDRNAFNNLLIDSLTNALESLSKPKDK